MFSIQQRDVPEQVVLSEAHHHVSQADLPEVNRAAMARLHKIANDVGGMQGTMFTVFHDEEYDENDINFEVCVPIGSAVNNQTDATVRVEPAHREAYVRLTKSQTYPPTIGTAYGAVAEWVAAQGLTVIGAPREVYFANFDAAGPDDEVFDVAFPIA
jgi:effector-binding domain-containing protein